MRKLVFAASWLLVGCGSSSPPVSTATSDRPAKTADSASLGSCSEPKPDSAKPADSAITITLPRSESGMPTRIVAIAIDGSERVTIDGKSASSDADLGSAVKSALSATPDATFIIMADAKVPYARVIHTMDVAKNAGATKFAMAVSR